MLRTLAALLAVLSVLSLPGCSKSQPGFSGSGAYRTKDPVWVTYGWSRGRMIYVIFFVPPSSAFNPDGVAAKVTPGKEPKDGDSFEGALDGYLEKSKAPFKASSKSYDISFEGKTYRTANGPVLLINVGTPSKVQQIQAQIASPPKDEPDIPGFMETQVRKLLKENPKIAEFPKEPPPPDKTKKK